MTKPYNYIYAELVQGPNDLAGLVAYGLYKQEKIEFIERVRADGQEATDAQISDFHHASNTAIRLKSYREQAEGLLRSAFFSVMQEQTDAIQKQFATELAKINAKHSETVGTLVSKNKFMDNVWQNVAANLIAAVIVALIVFCIVAGKYGFSDTLADWFGYKPKEVATQSR